MNRSFASLLVLMTSLAPMAQGAALHKDDFQTGLDVGGWGGGAGPTRIADGGPAGAGDAFMELSTLGSNLAVRTADAAWIGSYAAIGATRVRVDMRNAVGSDPLDMRAVLFGPASTSERWTSSASQLVPADGAWHSYEFSLAEGDLTHVNGIASYTALMDDVFMFMLRYDPGAPSATGEPVTAMLGLDNIELAGPALPQFAADFNHDDRVDGDDLITWSGAYGDSGQADADGDGSSTGADFLIWQQEFGSGVPAAGAVALGVPEPSSAALATALAGFAVAGRLRARRRE